MIKPCAVVLSVFLLIVSVSVSFPVKVKAASPTNISLNTYYSGYLNPGVSDAYVYTMPAQAGYSYVVETFGTTDTYLTVTQGSNTYTDDDSGEGFNAAVGFVGAGMGTQVNISVRHYSSSGSGAYTIQIRRQRAQINTFNYGNGDIDTTGDATIPAQNLSTYCGYDVHSNSNVSGYFLYDQNETGFQNLNSEVYFFSGHGTSDGMAVFYDGSTLTGFNDDSFTLMNHTKLAVWSSCYSAIAPSGHVSLGQASVNYGAKSAIAWPDEIGVSSATTFTNTLFQKLASAETVSQAASDASNAIIWPWDSIHQYVVYGDGSTNIQSAYEINNPFSVVNNANLEAQFKQDMSQFTYQSYNLSNGVKRYYKLINGLPTNDYYDLSNDNKVLDKSKVNITKDEVASLAPIEKSNINIPDSITVGNIKFDKLTKSEQHLAYYKEGNTVIPIEIIYSNYETNKNGLNIVYQDVTCINLNNQSKISYSDFNHN